MRNVDKLILIDLRTENLQHRIFSTQDINNKIEENKRSYKLTTEQKLDNRNSHFSEYPDKRLPASREQPAAANQTIYRYYHR